MTKVPRGGLKSGHFLRRTPPHGHRAHESARRPPGLWRPALIPPVSGLRSGGGAKPERNAKGQVGLVPAREQIPQTNSGVPAGEVQRRAWGTRAGEGKAERFLLDLSEARPRPPRRSGLTSSRVRLTSGRGGPPTAAGSLFRAGRAETRMDAAGGRAPMAPGRPKGRSLRTVADAMGGPTRWVDRRDGLTDAMGGPARADVHS